jgi:branched-chain amino acid transport system ATP-binding protein
MSALLEVRGLRVSYSRGSAVVHDVDLTLEEGRVTVILGANGAGKTSLLRGISGFWRSEPGRVRAGSVLLDGVDVTGRSPGAMATRGVVLVPESRKVFATLSVADNLAAMPSVGGRAAARRNLAEVQELFPILAERRSQLAGLLSGGERQMLAIARALLLSPRILLIDEASIGLSPIAIGQVFDRLKDVVDRLGTTLLLVEQNIGAALPIADSASVMEAGRLVLSGTAAQLADDDRIKRTYLGLEA